MGTVFRTVIKELSIGPQTAPLLELNAIEPFIEQVGDDATEAWGVLGLEGYVRQRTNVAETVEKLDGEDRQAILVKLFSDRKVLIDP